MANLSGNLFSKYCAILFTLLKQGIFICVKLVILKKKMKTSTLLLIKHCTEKDCGYNLHMLDFKKATKR